MARGINANLLRRWVREAEMLQAKAPVRIATRIAPAAPAFLPVQVPEPVAPAGDVRIEVRLGTTTVTVVWPVAAAAECASWMRELLR